MPIWYQHPDTYPNFIYEGPLPGPPIEGGFFSNEESKKIVSIGPFTSIVTATKRNNRYYGPTESAKMSAFLSEVATDLKTIFNEINKIADGIIVMASGYLQESDNNNTLSYLRKKIYHLESETENIIFTQAQLLGQP